MSFLGIIHAAMYLHWGLAEKGGELAAGPLTEESAGRAGQQQAGQAGQQELVEWPGWPVGYSQCHSWEGQRASVQGLGRQP